MNRAEQKLVLELCRFKNPDAKQIEYLKSRGVDQAVVLGQLMFHRVAGVAYATLMETGLLSLFHREFRTSLKAVYESACEKTKSFMEAVDSLAEVLNGTNVPYALLKGGYLCYKYPLREANTARMLYASHHQKRRDDVLPVIKKKLLSIYDRERKLLEDLLKHMDIEMRNH